jgi:spermidine synthase
VGRAADLQEWLEAADINTDRNLRLQYLAGMGSNAAQAATIYEDLILRLQFPQDLFVGSEHTRDILRQALTSTAKPPNN